MSLFDRNEVVLMDRAHYEYLSSMYTNEHGEMKLRTTSDNFITEPVNLIMKKVSQENMLQSWNLFMIIHWQGFPLMHLFNRMIQSKIEAGLIDLWTEQIVNAPKQRNNRRNNKALNNDHLKGAYFILTIGSLLSLWVFCAEFCLDMWQKWRARKASFRVIEFT